MPSSSTGSSSTSTIELTITIIVGGMGVLAISIVVYVLGSFLLMRPHTTSRAMGISMRELFREMLLASLTQPLLPLFYVLGHRMEPFLVRRGAAAVKDQPPVVFVHGYMQNRVGFLGLARALTRRGIGPLYGFNYPWFASIESNAARLERFIERVCEEAKTKAVDLVCHSMGGLVAIEMMRQEIETEAAEAAAEKKQRKRNPLKVRRCVTIATPHAGVAWRGPIIGVGATSLRRGSKLLTAHAGHMLAVPTLSVFSTHDNIVHPKETAHLTKRGGRDIEVEGFAHLSILFSPLVAEHVAAFLSEPGGSDSDIVVAADVSRGNGNTAITAASSSSSRASEEAGHDGAESRDEQLDDVVDDDEQRRDRGGV